MHEVYHAGIAQKIPCYFRDWTKVPAMTFDQVVMQGADDLEVKKHIDDIMYYIMDDMEASEIITAFQMIKMNFKGIYPDLIDMRVKSLWTLMSITTELNYQAAEQGKWQETDTVIGDALNKISQTDQEEATLAEYKKDRDALKKSNKDRLQRLEDKIKEANKKKKSNEDSPQ